MGSKGPQGIQVDRVGCHAGLELNKRAGQSKASAAVQLQGKGET